MVRDPFHPAGWLSSSCRLPWWPSGKRIRLPMRELQVRSLDQEDPLEKEMATHSSILAWEIPWTEEPGGLQSTGSQSQTQLSNSARSLSSCCTLLWQRAKRGEKASFGFLIRALISFTKVLPLGSTAPPPYQHVNLGEYK